jgi:hypothetical protein
MSDTKTNAAFDPFEAWRGMRDVGMDAWAKMMTEAVRTDAYAESSGAMLDAYLTTSAPFYDFVQKVIAQTLQELNLPSRADLASLSERLTNIELKLDDMDTKLDLAGKEKARRSPRKTTRKGAK